jgi:hypothetical protein
LPTNCHRRSSTGSARIDLGCFYNYVCARGHAEPAGGEPRIAAALELQFNHMRLKPAFKFCVAYNDDLNCVSIIVSSWGSTCRQFTFRPGSGGSA